MRGPRLRDALAVPAAAGPPEENRYGSASLNNHGAVLLELGDFDAALERLRSCRELDEVLESSEADEACALLNQAQCAFFKGDLYRCRTYTGPLLLPGTLSPSAAPAAQREARGLLRSAGAAWFVRFATAWARQRVKATRVREYVQPDLRSSSSMPVSTKPLWACACSWLVMVRSTGRNLRESVSLEP